MTSPYLTEEEIAGICKPLVQPAAMTRHLRSLGFHVKARPDGRPLVSRENYNIVMMGQAMPHSDSPAGGPNVQALLDRFNGKGASYGRNGKTEKEQPARVA